MPSVADKMKEDKVKEDINVIPHWMTSWSGLCHHPRSRLDWSRLVWSGQMAGDQMVWPWHLGNQVVCWYGTRLAQTPSHHPVELMLPKHQGECLPQQRRENKINIVSLPPSHFFSPLAIETMGVLGPKSMALVRDLGIRIRLETGEPRSTDYLLQHLSIAIQRGNSVSVYGGITTWLHFISLLLFYFFIIFFYSLQCFNPIMYTIYWNNKIKKRTKLNF